MGRRLSPVLAVASLLLLARCAGCEEENPCPSGLAECGGTCVDLRGDVANCGACGHACAAGQTCSNMLCCDAGLVNCGGACVDTQADEANCGTCGLACGLGTCEAGGCVCQTEPPTVQDCGDNPACVDTSSDPTACGESCTPCRAAEICTLGVCECLPPRADCTTACADLQTDEGNCGECDLRCATGATCAASACGCPTGQIVCGTAPGACVDTGIDEANCGSCGNPCGTGEQCCGGICSDPSTDEHNCGACGEACAGDESCTDGVCCTTGLPVCGAICCPGGTGCCDGACPYTHQNVLSGTYFSCTPIGTHTRAAAEEAARAWSASGVAVETVAYCAVDCLGWQTPGACTVWCYGTTQFSGFVGLNDISNSCDAACPYDLSRRWE